MSPLVRGIRLVLWLIASGLIVVGLMNVGLEFLRNRFKHTEISVVRCVSWSLPVLVGLALALKTPGWARKLADEEDEE